MMNGFEYAGVDAILAGSFRAAIYCRLSKDDDLDGESASIANQRDMLEKYRDVHYISGKHLKNKIRLHKKTDSDSSDL